MKHPASMFKKALSKTGTAGKGMFLILFLTAAVFAYGQSRDDFHIFFPHPTGGTTQQRAYFFEQFSMEITGAKYSLVDNKTDADFVMYLHIRPNIYRYDDGTEEAVGPDDPQHVLDITLSRAADDSEVIYFGHPFTTTEEMYEYNLFLVYRVMANAAMDIQRTAEAATVVNPEPVEKYWLSVGLVAGFGSSTWYYVPETATDGIHDHEVLIFSNMIFSFQAVLHIVRFLDMQFEVNLTRDFGTVNDTPFNSWSLVLPVLLRFTISSGIINTSVYAGAYPHIPLSTTGGGDLNDNYHYIPDQPGFSFGIQIGWKAGPGNIILDARYEYDGHWTNPDYGVVFYRTPLRVSAGYEIHIFKKKK